MRTVTGVFSLAVPVNAGALLFDFFGGGLSTTVGGVVSTVKLAGALKPTFSAQSFWLARAV